MTRPPITVNITRGAAVESRHAVDAVLMDGRGGVVRAWGDAERVFYPRSSVKLVQALPLIEANMTPKRIAEREGAAGEVLEQFNQQLKEKVGQGAPEGTPAPAARP